MMCQTHFIIIAIYSSEFNLVIDDIIHLQLVLELNLHVHFYITILHSIVDIPVDADKPFVDDIVYEPFVDELLIYPYG